MKKPFPQTFVLIVIGQVISLFGNAVLQFALPLYLLRQTGSAAVFGLVSAAAFVPHLLFSLVGGAVADRCDKGRIMVGLDAFTALLAVGAALAAGQVPAVPFTAAVLMLLYGIQGLYTPAVQASVPALLAGEQLLQGNAAINTVSTLAGLVGPALGGVLFGLWGLRPLLAVSAGCFAASAVLELFLRIPRPEQPPAGGLLHTVAGDWAQSLRCLWREQPEVLRVTALLALFNLVFSAAWVIGVPLLAVTALHCDDAALGLLQSMMGLGGLAGGILAGVLAGRLRLHHGGWCLLVCSAAAAGFGTAVRPAVPDGTGYALVTALTFVTMAAASLFSVQLCSYVQARVPAQLIGKVMAAAMALAGCTQPVGQAAYGLLFQRFAAAPQWVLYGAALASLAVALPACRLLKRLEA